MSNGRRILCNDWHRGRWYHGCAKSARAFCLTGCGVPIGPFGLIDRIGLDVVRDIELVYYRESGDAADAPPQLLLDKIARGELGIKTDQGFYTYPYPAFQAPRWLQGGEE